MMAVRWSWCVLALAGVLGCSGGAQPITVIVEEPGANPQADAGSDAATTTGTPEGDAAPGSEAGSGEDAGTASDAGPEVITLTGKNASGLSYGYALNFGDTIEVHFSKAPANQDAQMLVLLYTRGDGGSGFAYSHATFRSNALCQAATLQSTEPGVDDGQPLTVSADGRITGGPVHITMPPLGDFVAQFSNVAAPAATYACP